MTVVHGVVDNKYLIIEISIIIIVLASLQMVVLDKYVCILYKNAK